MSKTYNERHQLKKELLLEYNTDTRALHYQNDDIVRTACITKEDAEIHG